MFGAFGRAIAPADIGRHGGRSYDNQGQSFFFELTGRFFCRRRDTLNLDLNSKTDWIFSDICPSLKRRSEATSINIQFSIYNIQFQLGEIKHPVRR